MYVKAAVLQAFSDPSLMIRNAASQAIVSFLGILEPKNWPECLQHLFNLLESPQLEQQEVSPNFYYGSGVLVPKLVECGWPGGLSAKTGILFDSMHPSIIVTGAWNLTDPIRSRLRLMS